jgi:hypothetical protein
MAEVRERMRRGAMQPGVDQTDYSAGLARDALCRCVNRLSPRLSMPCDDCVRRYSATTSSTFLVLPSLPPVDAREHNRKNKYQTDDHWTV